HKVARAFNWRIIRVVMTPLYYVPHCKVCNASLWLPPDTPSPVVIVCLNPSCRTLLTYSLSGTELHESVPGFLMRLSVAGLRCENANCEHSVPLYGPPVPGNIKDKAKELDSWR